MIHRRQFVHALWVRVLAAPIVSLAQQPKVPRVGILIPETLSGQLGRVDALRAGLRDYGYIEGKTIAIEIRLPTFCGATRNCRAKRNGPHRCGPHVAWLPDLGSNQVPAD